MTTDAWQLARESFTRLWRRIQPDRADAVGTALDASREEVLTARTADDQEALAEIRDEWRARLRRLTAQHPEAVEELSRLLVELTGATEQKPAAPVIQRAVASGHARIYQAGRDQHVTER
ncbi:hypothetical protein ABZ832_21610 [Streptantibioticus parmotrematis]|uniref:hypothetical protein n=1 Tax=Streptantibioticus parmotrematis TaxID=2873249 RepID=UPI0034053E68